MKHLLKTASCLLVFVCTILLFASCEQDAQLKKYIYPMPEVSDMYPASGYVTQQLTITGNNFGDRIEPIKVYFNGVLAENVLSCKNNCIVVEVPENALSGEVTLQTWTNPAVSVGNFEISPLPLIYSVSSENKTGFGTNVAEPGEEVTITGVNFGTDRTVVSVSFNGTHAGIISLKDDEIVVTAPEGYLTGAVTVTVNEYTLTGTSMMNPNATGDVSIFYLKNYKRPFEQFPYADGQQGDGTMATPAGWEINSATKQFINKNASKTSDRVGGMFHNTDALGMQVGYGHNSSAGSITNGKMHQAFDITAGKYILEFTYVEANVASDNVYMLVNVGEVLPDADKVETDETVLAFGKFENGASAAAPKMMKLEFEVAESTKVSLGFSATMGKNKYFKVSDIKLTLLERK